MTKKEIIKKLIDLDIEFNDKDSKKDLALLIPIEKPVEFKKPNALIVDTNTIKDYKGLYNNRGRWTLPNGESYLDAGEAALRNYIVNQEQ